MQLHTKLRVWRFIPWYAGIFIVMLVFRIVYGNTTTDEYQNNEVVGSDYFSGISNLRKNYASEKYATEGSEQTADVSVGHQKYEKTASIKTKTSEYDTDATQIKATSASNNAVIQYEQEQGLAGHRQLHLMIGVNPDKFENLYNKLKKFGTLQATSITKIDKTNEYAKLNAQKTSIEKTLQSLYELKSKPGQINDFVSLGDKILEIEEKAQVLGVELGNFDTVNEFCTIRLSMYEGVTQQSISFFHRIKIALEWTLQYFALFLLINFGIIVTLFYTVHFYDRVKNMNSVKGERE